MNKKRKAGTWNGLSLLVLAVTLAAWGYLLWQIWGLHMLPGKLFLALCCAAAVMQGLLCLLLFKKKSGRWQKKTGHGKQIVGYVLSVLTIAGCILITIPVGKVKNTVSSITAPEKVNVVLEIYVRQDDPAQYLQDTAGYTFGLPADIAPAEIGVVLDELETLLAREVKTVEYANTPSQMGALLSGEVDAVILDTAYLALLEDLEEYAGYAEKVRLLDTRVVEKEVPQKEATNKKPLLPLRPNGTQTSEYTGFLVYVSGIDSRQNVKTHSRSDVNILVAVNLKTHQILMVNTPRDVYLVNPASPNGDMDKLTHCGIHGVENSMEALAGLYGHMPEYAARINFSGLETLVDAIGGVTVYSDEAFRAPGGVYIQKGVNYLNGKEALSFARERKRISGGDRGRGNNQMKLIAAIIDQLSAENILTNYAGILKSLEGMFATTMPAEMIGELVQTQISEMPQWEIFSFAVTGEGGTDHCWASGWYSYVMYPDEQYVSQASDLIEKVLLGEKLTEEDLTVKP